MIIRWYMALQELDFQIEFYRVQKMSLRTPSPGSVLIT